MEERDAAYRAKFREKVEADWSKHGVRFAASCGERYSGVWVAVSTGSDFYLGARSVFGTIKISLHKSGQCRIAITSEHLARMVAQGLTPPEARALHIWRRPTDLTLITPLVVRLIFPTNHFHGQHPVGKPNKKVVIFEAGAGKAVEIGFFYSRESTETLERKFKKIGKPIFQTELANGESVSMVAREADFDPSGLFPSVTGSLRVLSGAFHGDETIPDATAVWFTAPSDGEALTAIETGA
jgi:hypothetical protein